MRAVRQATDDDVAGRPGASVGPNSDGISRTNSPIRERRIAGAICEQRENYDVLEANQLLSRPAYCVVLRSYRPGIITQSAASSLRDCHPFGSECL